MSFSIITVNYNNAIGLNKTICNIDLIRSKTKSPVEAIIVDGGSTDDSLEIINRKSHTIDKWVSEKDKGIFDAMNKGIALASNNWLVFMNSGDTFYNEDILTILMAEDIDDSINLIYGDKIESGKVSYAQSLDKLKVGVIHACHQSMFFRRSLNIHYDKSSKVYGDYGYVVDHILRNPNSGLYLNQVISETEPDGVSSKVSLQKRYEKYQQVISKYGVTNVFLSLLYRMKLLFKNVK
ncbi:glycosyltransferase [Glaciecola sp. 2405UD65-10]|uniref:glycosyltransferase n=1 Tax=Glaciecola sp. 2405UD65-10 TaxID=3397244 RepID=UPI003B58B77D